MRRGRIVRTLFYSALRVPHSAFVPALSSLVSWYNTNREALAVRHFVLHPSKKAPREAAGPISVP